MPIENSVGAAKRRSRETTVCAAMTAAHQRRSVLYCAFHVCRAVRKICGMGCGSMSKSSSGCSASGNRNRRTSAGTAAKRKTSAGKILWLTSLKKGKRNQEYSPCKTLNSSRAGSMHKPICERSEQRRYETNCHCAGEQRIGDEVEKKFSLLHCITIIQRLGNSRDRDLSLERYFSIESGFIFHFLAKFSTPR